MGCKGIKELGMPLCFGEKIELPGAVFCISSGSLGFNLKTGDIEAQTVEE
jgi:hypothetical protein